MIRWSPFLLLIALAYCAVKTAGDVRARRYALATWGVLGILVVAGAAWFLVILMGLKI